MHTLPTIDFYAANSLSLLDILSVEVVLCVVTDSVSDISML